MCRSEINLYQHGVYWDNTISFVDHQNQFFIGNWVACGQFLAYVDIDPCIAVQWGLKRPIRIHPGDPNRRYRAAAATHAHLSLRTIKPRLDTIQGVAWRATPWLKWQRKLSAGAVLNIARRTTYWLVLYMLLYNINAVGMQGLLYPDTDKIRKWNDNLKQFERKQIPVVSQKYAISRPTIRRFLKWGKVLTSLFILFFHKDMFLKIICALFW